MSSEKLYENAFAFKKTKLWDRLDEEELFAAELSGGLTGYINVRFSEDGAPALRLFLGEEGFGSFSLMEEAFGPWESVERLEYQNFLQCELLEKDGMPEEEREIVREYAHKLGVRLAGKYTYPRFSLHQPCCIPWLPQTEQEEELLCEALGAAVELGRLLAGKTPKAKELRTRMKDMDQIVILKKSKEGYVWDQIGLPERKPIEWPAPEMHNDIAAAALRKLKKKGVWECEVIPTMEPVQDEPLEIPRLPFTLLAVDDATEMMLPVSCVKKYPEDAEELLGLLVDSMVKNHVCPARIKAYDDRTYLFLKGLCGRLGIPLSVDEDLLVLEEAKMCLYSQGDLDETLEEMDEMLDELSAMDNFPWEELPPGLMEAIKMLTEEECLPKSVAEKMNRLIDLKESSGHSRESRDTVNLQDAVKFRDQSQDSGEFRPARNQSCVISVSLGQGCYRHIQISCESTLLELQRAINDAFEFDDDHAHAFFMDNKMWSRRESYYSEGMESPCQSTGRNRLCDVGIYKGKAFKYLFDFGDEWMFQCKVLRMVNGETPDPVVIRSKGEAPNQYGWDDWE